MNFYTLTFKRKILVSFLLILLNLVIIDTALYFIAQSKTTKTTFINNKFSKIKHFKLNNPTDKDIVFVGSSRTFYQISTNIFKNRGIDIYNFGVSGAQYEDYPTIIKSLNKLKPKQVIISLFVTRLYNQLYISNYPTLEEISYYFEIDKMKFLKSLEQWIINRHLFLEYSEPLYYKLKSLYSRFNSYKKEKNRPSVKNLSYYSKMMGCTVFDIKQISDNRAILKCSNGDGILIGNNPTLKKREIKKLTNFNVETVKYLNKLIEHIDKSIKVTFVLEPIFHNPYRYNISEIKEKFNSVEIIDLSNFNTKDSYWSDNWHLNYKGREKYSKQLSDLLK